MTERTLLFGPTGQLVGTIATPATGATAKRIGILLFNAGVIHRIGPHRLNVRLARAFAAEGYPSIRFDLGGQGDSPRPTDNRAPKDQVMGDIKAAMDALADTCLVKDFVLFGFCSGGYHGYDAVIADPRIKGLVMFDAFLYSTAKSGMNRYRLRIAEHGWVKAVGGAAWRRLQGLLKKGERGPLNEDRTAYYIGIPREAEFAATLRGHLDRGVKVHMIYAGQSFEKYNYAEQFADAFRNHGIADRVTTQYYPDIDHAVTDLEGQRLLVEHIRDWVKAEMTPA